MTIFQAPFFLSVVSGVLLTLSFPGFRLGFLAWTALVPFLFAVRQAKSKSQAAGCGLTFALTFFILSMHWLTYVSVFGWLFVAALESSLVLIFVLGCWQFRSIKNSFLRILGPALAWTTAEWIRAELPVFGLGWNLLAYSQSDDAWIRLAANTAGAYGLGFLIALVNVCIFEIAVIASPAVFAGRSNPRQKRSGMTSCVTIIICLILLFAHGIYHSSRPSAPKRTVRISLIQGNIPQSVKWEAMARDKIIEIYSKLTEIAGFDQPDLIIWPEAAYPGYFNRDLDHVQITELIKKIGVPVVIGSPHLEGEDTAFNSAYLLDAEGVVRQRYDKQHLVPFGEYVPLGPLLGFLNPLAYTLGVSDFSAGREFTVFHAMNHEISFSTLICFEDIFPGLARGFADRGAEFLTVMTNDAWFGPTAAAYQHEQASIFRAIENGIPVVRAANTGVSSFISSKGEVLARVTGRNGRELFVTGKKTYDLPLDPQPTLYRKGGWIFPYAALIGFVIIFIMEKKNEK